MLDILTTRPFLIWATIGVLCFIIEMLSGTMYFLLFGICALLVALISAIIPSLGFEIAIILFCVFSILSVFIGRRFFPKASNFANSRINNPNHRLIGEIGIADEDFKNNLGGVLIGDTRWRAICNTNDPKAGTNLKIIGVDGATLFVQE
jgi:inner membrane protein